MSASSYKHRAPPEHCYRSYQAKSTFRAGRFVFEDHAFQKCLDNLLFLGGKPRDGLKLELEIAIGAALICTKDQHICTHLQSNSEPTNHVQGLL